jgi:D-galactarolactone cycloisomerase
MKITHIEVIKDFDDGALGHKTSALVKVGTDSGIEGKAFSRPDPQAFIEDARQTLIGKDPHAIEDHIQHGLLKWAAIEHALWDIIGKEAGLPIHKLLGGSRERMPVYLTCVWPGGNDQSHVPPTVVAEQAVAYMEKGFKAMKIRCWRPDPMDDVAVVRAVKEAVGDRMEIMVDRTAAGPGWIWDFGTAYRVARGMEEAGASWLEEPFQGGEVHESARLNSVVDIPITGGEGDYKLSMFREYLKYGSFEIVQPDAFNGGGILNIKKIGALAEAFGKRCILHGSNGFGLAAGLQISAAMPNCDRMEICVVTPPSTPQEHWEPANQIIANPPLFTINDGYIDIPQSPGLGFELL